MFTCRRGGRVWNYEIWVDLLDGWPLLKKHCLFKNDDEMVYLHFEIIVFAWNAQCFTIFCVLLHVFLPALSRTLNQYRGVSLVSSCKPVFLILKISQYGELRWQVQLFLRYSCKNWYKNWYLHFPKNYDHQICQAGTVRVDSSKTNHASAISTTRVPIANKLWRMVTYRDGLLPISCCP